MPSLSVPRMAIKEKAATSAAPTNPARATRALIKPTLMPPVSPEVKRGVKPKAKPQKSVAVKPAMKSSAVQAVPGKGKSRKNPKKAKLIRDSFAMPESEFCLLAQVKSRCIANGLAAKKSEVLRAAIIGFAALSDAEVMKALQALGPIKTGRPPKEQKQD